jgi:hypothetical protein
MLSGEPNTVARNPYIDRLLAALWRGEFEAFSQEPCEPYREATLSALTFCDAVPDFPEEELELEYERLSRLEFEDYGEVGQAILVATEFPRNVITNWLSSLPSAADNLNIAPLPEPSSQPTARLGRPTKYDYDEIDRFLADLFDNKGRKKFSSVSKVVAYVRDEIGKDELPPDSTIRSHIVAWIKKKAPRP